jgi:hypothetical protein
MSNAANYSIQQIKFEFLSYIKEFGGRGTDWFIGMAEALPDPHSEDAGINASAKTIWICKPALSARAARLVRDHMTSRHGVRDAQDGALEGGSWIYMYRYADTPK